jgi:hypothetical protein
MTSMRALPVVIVAFLLFIGVSMFLVYGGRRAMQAPLTESAPRIVEPPRSPLDPGLHQELEAISGRLDDLVTRVDRLEHGSERQAAAPAPDPKANEPVRDAALRAQAEERDLRELPPKTELFSNAVFVCHGAGDYPGGFAMGESVKVLTEAEKRYQEIRRRVLPLDPSVALNETQRAQYAQEITTLREWRSTELTRIAGVDAAQKLIASLAPTQPLPTTLP